MAFSLGASRWRVFRTVTLPLAIPGLANAFLLLFAASLADFATPLILAGNQFPVLPTQAYLQITGLFDLRGGAALSFALLVPALIVFLLQRYWVSRRFYVTITGKGAGQTPFDSISPAMRYGLLARLRDGCAGDRLLLRAAPLRVARDGARRQSHLHAAALPRRSSPTARRRSATR